ncbi:MAG: LLM class F420-dependent oxidoreductase [Acidimicrobiales bacterium]
MKLGVMFANTAMGLDFDEIQRLVVGLEDAGFDTFSSNDHVIGGHPDRSDGVTMNTVDTAVHEPIVLLSMLAAVTSRIELTTAILIAPQRQTVLLAKQTAQLDLLSKGRLRLGVGVGRNWIEYESLGQDFTTRGKRMEEQVEVLRMLWSQELVSYEGRFHHLDRVGINPRSQRGNIPIWMGSYFKSISEVVLERIGRVADGWMPQFPPEVLAPVLERVRGYASDAGRDPNELGIECGIRAKSSDEPDEWIRLANEYQRLGATHLKVMPTLPPGSSTDEQLELATRWYETVGPEIR